ncbi:MAG: VOC family protein [Candidatus Hydrogenedentales bacterium]
MGRQIFVNLPVRNLQRARGFFHELGFSFNEQFSDEKAACMVVADDSYVMLLHEDYFKGFLPNPVSDAKKSTEVLLALSCESRDEVDALTRKAVDLGGNTYNKPQDHGFMYQHGFQDLDGHVWELMSMAPAGVEQA